MSYNSELQKKETPPFADLYEFDVDGFIYKYTSYYKDINCSLGYFNSAVIKSSNLKRSTSTTNSNEMTLTIYVKQSVAQEFIEELFVKTKVTVYRYFLDANVYKLVFVGYGETVGIDINYVVLKLKSLVGGGNQEIPYIFYQIQCNNFLYDKRCKVPKTSFQLIVNANTIQQVSSTQYKCPAFATKENGWFTYGYIECNKHYRTIIGHTGDTITVQYPFNFNITSQISYVYAGCNKTFEMCKNKFNNERNFLGFRRIPYVNPVIYGVQ